MYIHNSKHAVNNRAKDNCSKTYHETRSIAAAQEAFPVEVLLQNNVKKYETEGRGLGWRTLNRRWIAFSLHPVVNFGAYHGS